MPSRQNTKSILHDRKLAPKKRFGQNFLVNKDMVHRIIHKAAPKPTDTIIEFGVGLGALTHPLAAQVERVIGLEVDSGIVRMHQEQNELPENVTLLHEDIMKADFPRLAEMAGGRMKIIANLPYSVSNPLLFKLIEHAEIMDSAVLMLQKEVGQRLVAKHSTKDYGVLSVLLGSKASVELLMTLGPGNFHPRPKVDSVVVKIVFHPKPKRVEELPPHDYILLKKIVKAAFQQRRKTLLNALSGAVGSLKSSKVAIKENILKTGLSEKRRPDTLTLEEYITLTRVFAETSEQDGS